jgi:predicted phosphodiesterase
MRRTIRLIGDAHGKIPGLMERMRAGGGDYDRCVQLGDLGFKKEYDRLERLLERSRRVDADRFSFVPGNHDDYDNLPSYSLGDFGDEGDFFFARGAWSIDRSSRTPGYDWWPEEQMSMVRMRDCLEAYERARPRVVLSHDGPKSVIERMFGWLTDVKSRTPIMLDAMLEAHEPELWVFGHHHRTRRMLSSETAFVCLGELQAMDVRLDESGSVDGTRLVSPR